MQFLADECCDALVVRTLRELGHDVTYIAELAPGLTDIDVLSQSVAKQQVLLTEDRDFGELVFRDQAVTYGVVLLRISPEDRNQKASRVTELVQLHETQLPGAFTIVTANTIRIRLLPNSEQFDL